MSIVLALETTEKYGSVALSDGESLLAEIDLPRDRRSAQTLAPAMDAILRENGVSPKDVDAVAVVVGPGSFTGLRVGVATAKMFAYAVGARVIAFRTHEVVAADVSQTLGLDAPRRLSVAVDAQRGDVVLQNFLRDEAGNYRAEEEPRLVPAARWWERPGDETVLAGPAMERWHARIPEDAVLADERYWTPRAAAMLPLARERLRQGRRDDPWTLQPAYSRPSAAEERLKTV